LVGRFGEAWSGAARGLPAGDRPALGGGLVRGSASVQEGGEAMLFRGRCCARPPSTPPAGRPRAAPPIGCSLP